MDILYVGLDVGKKFCQVYAFSEQGEVMEARVATQCLGSWEALLSDWARRFELHAAYEAGPHYEWMHEFLERFCRQVVMVNPAAFAVISQSQKKTDKNDARKLAEGVRRGELPAVFVPPARVRADRRLVSFIHWRSRRAASAKTRLRSVLLSYRLDYPRREIASAKARVWFEREAKPRMDEQGWGLVNMLLDELALLERQRQALDAELPKRLGRYGRAADVLDSVPGFGPLSVLAILSAIVEIGRLGSAKDLCGYFGTCGRVYQSGQTLRLGALTKRGNKTVRWLLSQALSGLHRGDARARQRYRRLKRRKRTGIARGAQVNWLVRIVFYMLSREQAYRMPERLKQAA